MIVEFLGMPRAGKSTQTNLLKDKFNAKVFTDREIPFNEGETVYDFNNRYLDYLEIFFKENAKEDLILLDRGYYDCKIWPQAHYINGYMSKKERDFLFNKRDKLDINYENKIMFMVKPKIALLRHKQGNFPPDSIVMKEDYLNSLFMLYIIYSKEINAKLIDGNAPVEEVQDKLLRLINLLPPESI
ncbi:MAG: hypothetical protein KKA65_03810 [Nanoarchaeota archaeon]|nr:hypothetical protein [Nanoarchaeota archaeon]MBU4242033.1 hypothetical protein [Nanoarchaeota archaeon]MBU4351727.1 hypothetical protein [Nanoarchaeota archaeon]MBU4456603.1 hypothetical protein [Nanoarchaeota archaeon]MCG2719240.1 hypothetical protein [Nanoarchaeota archaeon]